MSDFEDRQRFLAQRDVSRETLAGLEAYEALLRRWQASINLVGPRTLDHVWTRHFLDSIQIVDHIGAARHIVDLGSGAGFPGLILALDLRKIAGTRVTLVESNGKKVAFLRAVAHALDLPVDIRSGRIEEVVPSLGPADLVTARALAPLTTLLGWSEPLLKSGAVALFPKGRDLDKELVDAARCWSFRHTVLPSIVESDSALVRLTDVRRIGA